MKRISPVKLVTLLLTDFSYVNREPLLARAAFCAEATTCDEFYVALLRSLVMHQGDWRAAAKFMIERKHDLQRVRKFESWAAKLTAPAKRGLLIGWKGGAS